MKILQVVAFGLAIIMLKFLVPKIFSGMESVLLALFDTMEDLLRMDRGSFKAGFLPVPTVKMGP